MIDRLTKTIVEYPPARRRRLAILTFVWSLIAMVVNVGLFAVGVIDESNLILITLILSWLAVTITALDLVATTDVREEADG